MPRRAGKAASRRARTRAAQRGARTARPAPEARPQQPDPVPPVGTPDAREAESLDPPRRVSTPAAVTGDSRLSGNERAEYHYVEKDLRNIAVLTALMVVLLLAAWLAFLAMGLTT